MKTPCKIDSTTDPHSIVWSHGCFEVIGLPAFDDNYIWLIQSTMDVNLPSEITVVDPGDAAPVIDFCSRTKSIPRQILLTHHHTDHTGGVAVLRNWVTQQHPGIPVDVLGPASEGIPDVTWPLSGGDCVELISGVWANILALPGHTRGHLGYLIPESSEITFPALFSGDVLFGLGCGRLFEGTAAQMFSTLEQIRQLPAETRVYCAHEYTLLNLPFALAVDPENAALQARAKTIRQSRAADVPTVPLSLADECATNPFLRADQPTLQASAMVKTDGSASEVFAQLRRMRDSFKIPR